MTIASSQLPISVHKEHTSHAPVTWLMPSTGHKTAAIQDSTSNPSLSDADVEIMPNPFQKVKYTKWQLYDLI
jgi:hypothetical protein